MKIIYTVAITASLSVTWGCKDDAKEKQDYTFIKEYCAQITVGGVVGVDDKCFEIGDVVVGAKKSKGVITIRIADHLPINEGPANSASYQEFLDIPVDYLVPKE
ncbi:hypothetical protein [Parachryseolinea silvisoli]|jgi:hypothetical protein|uniref:hypothetical protein n=1 Tax=Parachryseolinea silvisoli TaxID=2873601 RepID=UPI002265B750|nr:hypothetical protein [Parachryseolinea silvisoli]MCD9015612.1 hypothetical protein [Parachryseolinea silvisoli]